MKPLKRLERYITAIFKLGRTEWMAKQAYRNGDHIQALAADLRRDLGGLQQDVSGLQADLWEAVAALERGIGDQDQRNDRQVDLARGDAAANARAISDLGRRLDLLMLQAGAGEAVPSAPDRPLPGDTAGFQAFKDSFYHLLENRYRGSREEIARRLRIYLPEVEAAVLRTGGKPVMDIGCGRGEWLSLLAETGLAAFGVDTNAVQIDQARREGLDVRQGDALAMLAEAEDASLSVITAHHLVEHLPFDAVAWIAREAMRVLAPGGMLIFETPNTRNVLVGATTFHTDPTHLKPMPEQVLGVLLETAGYHPVDIRHIHAHERFDEFLAKPDFNDELAHLMFGPQDLAVLGTRPAGE